MQRRRPECGASGMFTCFHFFILNLGVGDAIPFPIVPDIILFRCPVPLLSLFLLLPSLFPLNDRRSTASNLQQLPAPAHHQRSGRASVSRQQSIASRQSTTVVS